MNWLALSPPVLMALLACLTLLFGVFGNRAGERSKRNLWLNLAGQCIIGWSLLNQWFVVRDGSGPFLCLSGSLSVDGLGFFTHALVWMAAVGFLLTSYRWLAVVREEASEYYALAAFAQCGMYFMAAGADLVSVFLGVELTAISFYILVGFTRRDPRSNEAALKYLLLGAVSSGFLLYGFSLIYGATGSLDAASAGRFLAQSDTWAILSVAFVSIGLFLKISAAPFHTWAPDAYDGAPTPVVGYLSVASKIAAFAVVFRLLGKAFELEHSLGQTLAIVSAVLSLTVGSIAAITQERSKRLFAYSGVAHAGYVLLGIIAGAPDGAFVYLLVYAIMNLGAFALLTSLRSEGVGGEQIADLRGLSRRHPVHAALFSVLLLSLAGIPPTAGFIGKYFIFAALIKTHHLGLAIVAALYVVVSLYFYFRLVREMYLEPQDAPVPLETSLGTRLTLIAAAAATLFIGILPEPVLRQAGFLSETLR